MTAFYGTRFNAMCHVGNNAVTLEGSSRLGALCDDGDGMILRKALG